MSIFTFHSKSKLRAFISLFLLLIFILPLATLGILYVKQATPQRLLAKFGFPVPEETNWALVSWNSSLEQLSYDADAVFIGDSLIRGLNPQEYFSDKKVLNLGLSGDSLSGIAERSYIISHFTPELIFVEGGINSIRSSSVEDLAALYDSMIASILDDNPNGKIFIQSILPISNKNQSGNLTNENIAKLNVRLQEIALKHGVTYIDVYSVYEQDGQMNPEYTKDGIHLKDEYKHLWLDVLSKYINEAL